MSVHEESNNTKKGWNDKLNQTKISLDLNPTTTINKAKQTLNKKTKERIDSEALLKTKLSHLLTGKLNWIPGKRPEYMNKMTRTQASTIFKARTRMLDIKQNYKNKYPNPICRMCNIEPETQTHILEKCVDTTHGRQY